MEKVINDMNYLLPYKILIYFNLATLVLFSFSPMQSACSGSHWITVFYIFFNIVCWGYGYKQGVKKGNSINVKDSTFLSSISPKVLTYFFLFYLITLLPKYAYELSQPVFDINGMTSRIAIGLNDPSAGYSMSRGTPPYSWSLYVLISIIDGIFISVGLLSWRKLKTWTRVLFALLCVIEVLKWFGKGTNFGIIMMLVSVLFAYLARNESSLFTKRRSIFPLLLLILLVSTLALMVFSHNMEGRAGGDLESVNEAIFNLNYNSPINILVIDYCPPRVVALYSFLVSYLTGGYTNLECAFQCPFDWTWFMGSNPSKANLADFVLHTDISSSGYTFAISQKYGIDPYINWHSCYAWLANDVSLIFVPLLVFFIGKLTSISLVLFKKNNDLLSGVLFIIFTCMCFFFFANNNYISSIFYSFMVFFPIWFFTRIFRIR